MHQLHTVAGEMKTRSTSLQRNWESVKAVWHDDSASQFELQHWQPFADQMRLMLAELEKLLQTIDLAERRTSCKG